MTDLVVISLERWDGVWRRNQHLIAGLLRSVSGLRVLFVEPPTDPLFDLTKRRRPRPGGVRPIQVRIPGLRPGSSLHTYQPTKIAPRRLSPGTDTRRAGRVVTLTGRLGFTGPILWVNDPMGAEVMMQTGWPTLYDITDDWLLADRSPQERERLNRWEQLLLSEAREVVVCSPALARSKGATRPVQLIPNAVDIAAYREPHQRPDDLPPGRTALYVGTLHRDRLDVCLCGRVAMELSGVATVVMLGPVALPTEDVAWLERQGVRLLGARPTDDVPAYLQHADVLLVPHLVNSFTDSLDPIKAYEYRASGRPVVSTPVAGFRELTGGAWAIAERDRFLHAVLERLRSGPAEDAGVSGVPDWSERVTDFRRLIAGMSPPDRQDN